MKLNSLIYLSLALVWFTSCSSTETVETKEDFAQVELPDSSIVYLNHNSKLTYDKNFSPRRVRLEGDAFFSVNDGETPFVIESGEDEETTVLGTEFWMAVSNEGVAIEVEIGVVSIRIGSINEYREVKRGRRFDYGRHDNGLHLGQAKYGHKSWIKVMEKDFRTNGKVMKRSYKHASKGNVNPLLKGNSKPKAKPKSGGGGLKKILPKGNDKGSKGGGKKDSGKKGKKG